MKTFDLFGEVGWEITVNSVKDILKSNKNEDIHFIIASLGGDVNHGLAIHDLIKGHEGKTKATIIGMTASAATIIAMSCNEIEMSENAFFLVHNAWSFTSGNAEDLEKEIDTLSKIDDIMVNIYSKRTGMNEDDLRSLMKDEEWLSAEEAKEMGFIDSIVSSIQQIAANYKLLPNRDLETKLKKKMNIFKNKKEDSKAYILNLKEGQLLANAENPEAGVEVMPLGETTLDDGEIELADGRVIVVKDGKIESVKKAEEEEEEEENNAAVIGQVLDSVSELLAESQAKFEERFNKIEASLKAQSSNGKPPKGKLNNAGIVNANTEAIANVKAKLAEKRNKFIEERNN